MSIQRTTQDIIVLPKRPRGQGGRRSMYERRPVVVPIRSRRISDVLAPVPTASRPEAVRKTSQHEPPRCEVAKLAERQVGGHNMDARQRTRKKASVVSIFSIVLVVVLFAIGGGVALLQLKTNHYVAAQVDLVQQQAASSTGNEITDNAVPPDETKPSNLQAYIVPPDQPRYLRIAKLDVFARVRKLGVKANNELMAPNNIYDTGWYEESAKPADAGGAMLVDGHVHGPSNPGVFAGLKKLQAGDVIEVERGDGQKFNFVVVESQSYDADATDMAAALTSIVPGKLGLNLITCSGPLDDSGNHYEQRLIVYAVAE